MGLLSEFLLLSLPPCSSVTGATFRQGMREIRDTNGRYIHTHHLQWPLSGPFTSNTKKTKNIGFLTVFFCQYLLHNSATRSTSRSTPREERGKNKTKPTRTILYVLTLLLVRPALMYFSEFSDSCFSFITKFLVVTSWKERSW